MAACVAAGACSFSSAHAQQGDGTDVQISTNVSEPNKLPPTSDRIGQLKLPEGFAEEPFKGSATVGPLPFPTADSSL